MFRIIGKKIRIAISGMFPGRLPKLYSTLDNLMEVPVQVAAYQLAVNKYIHPGDKVLDVGFGLGYGLKIMAKNARELMGIEIDKKAVSHAQKLVNDFPEICELKHYDGCIIPYDTGSFDVVTCIDVIEHVPDYTNLIEEIIRVSNRVVLLSTPNRVPENTRPDGKPKNYWHLREWSYEELNSILQKMSHFHVEWNFLSGPWNGPFDCTSIISQNTLSLTPALILPSS